MQSGSMETDAAAVPALPDDVIAAILGRLLARSLAASRCACKVWRDLVDERRLLQQIRRLLPHSVSGIFINYADHWIPHFFARPTSSTAAGPMVEGDLSDLLPERRRPYSRHTVADHCNGLVLYQSDYGELHVCNPTTRRRVRLPPLAAAVPAASWRRAFLAFSPAVSPHYQVLVAPFELVPEERQQYYHPLQQDGGHPAGDTEWPPSRWTWHVFSSRSGRWRERVFVRQGEPEGIVADLRMDSLCWSLNPRWRYAVYRQGALYVHCRGEYVARLSMSAGDYSYRVIKSPINRSEFYIGRSEFYKNVRSYLGRSNGELYFVAINTRRLRVWMLNDDHESQQQHDPMAGSEWVLKHDRVLRSDAWWDLLEPGPWILDDYYNRRKQRRKLGQILDDYHNRRNKIWRKLDWSSDGDDEDDIICSNEGGEEAENGYPETFHFLGFHPYREVIFLPAIDAVVAYHLTTSKRISRTADTRWRHGVAAVPVDMARVLVEERAVAGEGVCPSRRGGGIVANVRMDSLGFSPNPRWHYAVYRQGALYVHCRGEYVARLSLSTGDYSYRVIKSPIDRSEFYTHCSEWSKHVRSYLGRSKGELYFVAINTRRLRVWMLNDHESQLHDPMAGSEWVLKHDRVLRPDAWWDLAPGPWILDDYYNRRKQRRKLGPQILDDYHNRRKEFSRKLDWSSDGDDDDDIICSNGDGEKDCYPENFHFLGFHPYREVIFLAAIDAVVAYHLTTSKVQYLGVFRPNGWNRGLWDSFVYTPCHDLRHRGSACMATRDAHVCVCPAD